MPAERHDARAALTRSLAALAIEGPNAQIDRDRELYPLQGSDMAQHIQVEVNGRVGADPQWSDMQVYFPVPFMGHIDATRSEGSVEDPQMTYGVMMTTRAPIILQPQLTGYIQDETEAYTGATLQVLAWRPDGAKRTSFSAKIHLTFFGWGAPSEDESQE